MPFGAIDLYGGSNAIAGTNLFKVDKSPLNQIDVGVEDVIGKQAKSAGTQVNAFVQSLVQAILGLDPTKFTAEVGQLWTGSYAYLNQFFGDIEAFLHLGNGILGTNGFDLQTAITDFVNGNLKPTNLIAMLVSDATTSGGVTGFIPLENLAMSEIAAVIGGAQGVVDAILASAGYPPGSGTTVQVDQYFTDLLSMLANPAVAPTTGTFNPSAAVNTFITDMLHPSNMLAPMNPLTSLLFPANVPGLDATKITSGIFPQSMVNITSIAAGLVTGVLGAGQIPGLDATKIISGVLASGQIPGLDASKIVSGLLSAGQIPGLDATKIISGVLATGQIPNLDASKIVSGLLNAAQIPGLDATKITSGLFSQSQVSGLPAALAAALTSLSPLNAQNLFNQVPVNTLGMIPYSHVGGANPNLVSMPGFDSSGSIINNPAWIWDGADGYTSLGCASTTANAGQLTLVSNVIPVAAGQTMTVGARVKYLGLTATAAQNALRVNVAAYLGPSLVATTMVAFIASPSGNSAGWVLMSGPYTVPAGVDNIVVQLQVTNAASAGTVKYDDASCVKTGLMSGNWMSGISGTVAADIQNAVDQIFQASHGGSTTGNALGTILASLTNIPGPNIVTSLIPSVIPGLDATKIISGVMALGQVPGLPASKVTSGTFLASLIPTLDATKIATGVLAIAQIPASQLGISNVPDIQALTNQITTAFNPGASGTDALINDARSSMDGLFHTTQQNSAAIQAISVTTGGASNSGVSITVDFSQFPDGTQLPATQFNATTYTGAGTSTMGVKSGVMQWYLNGNGSRTGTAHHLTPTVTDYQAISCTLNAGPSGAAAGYVLGRVNAADNSFVYIKVTTTGFLQYAVELGTVVAGVKTVWVSPRALPTAYNARFLVGSGGGLRTYQLYVGGTQVINYTEVGTTSQVGANNRFWGLRGETNGSDTPAAVTLFGVADSQPPNYVGSFFRQYRGNTAVVGVNSGYSVLAGGFFDTLDALTPDFAFSAATNSLTIGYTGTYYCNLRYAINNLPFNAKFDPCLYKNGVLVRRGNGAFADSGSLSNSPSGVGTGFVVYCNQGDVLQPGFWAAGSYGSLLTGASGGADSYFEVGLLNRSLA